MSKGRQILLFCLLLVVATIQAQDETQVNTEFTIHVVQRGETLLSIAQSYNLSTQDLLDANSLGNPNDINVGQRLLIPLPPPDTEIPQIHTVQPGETLQSIANLYGKSLGELVTINEITNIDRIFVGQVLQIVAAPVEPTTITTETANNPETVTATLSPTQTPIPQQEELPPILHTVRSGDTLGQIARRYGLTVNEIVQANSIANTNLIFAGQQLIIPGLKPPEIATDLPLQISQIDFEPLIFTEGETGRIALKTVPIQQLSGTFLGQPLTILSQQNNTVHHILIGIPMFTEIEIYPLTLQLHDNTGNLEEIIINVQVIGGAYGVQDIRVLDDRLDLLDPAIENYESELLQGITVQITPERLWDQSLSLPAAATMNGPYGTRRSYNGGEVNRFHSGADFAGAPGSSILAAASGRVVLVDTLNIRGKTTMIDHGWGVYTLYAHQQDQLVQIGDIVESGQTIGTVGSTGRVTGPHLHWEVWVNGVTVNPLQWVQEVFP